MHSLPKCRIFILAAIVTVLLASLACSLLSNEPLQDDLQSTIVALEITKIYLENQPNQEPVPPVEQVTMEPPPPITIPENLPTETPIQQADTPDISFEGVQFSFDPGIASSVNTAIIPGKNMGEDFFAFETYPTYFEFSFNQYPASDHFHTPTIIVYPVEDYRAISGFAQDQFNKLASVLVNRPGGSSMSDLPFLPLWPAAQLFSAQVSYFDFQNGSGVRFLTMFGQDIFPVDNHNLIYTYQGMTQDGQYYISAVFPITHSGLPDDGTDVIGENFADFYNNWESYLATTLRFLGEQPLESFTPSIILLDELVASILIER